MSLSSQSLPLGLLSPRSLRFLLLKTPDLVTGFVVYNVSSVHVIGFRLFRDHWCPFGITKPKANLKLLDSLIPESIPFVTRVWSPILRSGSSDKSNVEVVIKKETVSKSGRRTGLLNPTNCNLI